MHVNITAIFSTHQAAQNAADCMAVGANNQMALSVCVEEYNNQSITGLRNLLGARDTPTQLLDISPTSSTMESSGTTSVLRINCRDELSGFAIKELSALGAEKITLSALS